MKRILIFLAHLYPAAWRERYGAEYEALLDERTPHAADVWDVLWSAVKMRISTRSLVRIVLPCSLAGALAATAIFTTIPTRYASQVFLKGLGSNAALAEQVKPFRSNDTGPFSQELLTSIIKKRNLYPADRARMSLDDVVHEMYRSVKLKGGPIGPGEDAFTISWIVQFDYPDPVVAQQVVGDLTDGLMEWNLHSAEKEAAAGYPHSAGSMMTIKAVSKPSLPQTPEGLTRFQFLAIGLLAGSIVGLILAPGLGSRFAPSATAA